MLGEANRELQAGSFSAGNREYLVDTGGFLRTAEDVGGVVAGVAGGRPVYLRDVATIVDGPEEPADYVFFGRGSRGREGERGRVPRRDPLGRQAQGHQRDRDRGQGAREGRRAERDAAPRRRPPDGHTELRRDGRGEVERAAAPHADRGRLRVDPHLAHPGAAGGRDRGHGHPRHPRPHPGRLLSDRLHAEPGDAVRPHLLHRHPRGRRDRGGGEHRPPLPASRRTAAAP